MKKLITLLAVFAFVSPVFAADKYASVDIDKVLKGYKKTDSINKTFQKREADIRVFIVDAQKSVVGATTDTERKKLEDEYEIIIERKALEKHINTLVDEYDCILAEMSKGGRTNGVWYSEDAYIE